MTSQRMRIFILALSMGVAFGGSAWAATEPEIHFYAVKPWAVDAAPVTRNGETVQNCAVQSEFNNGFVVRLDGSSRWVETMSINFRQDVFEPGKNYEAALTVPGKKAQKLQAQATQPSVLVVTLHGQKDLYQAMRDSAVFDIAIDNNNFRFYLSGFSSVSNGFERCMAGGPLREPDPNAPREAGTKMDPYSTATLNEAIAMEKHEQEAIKTGITEINPENPQAVVSKMEETTTSKLAGQAVTPQTPPAEELLKPEPEVIEAPRVVEQTPDAPAEDITAEAAPVEPVAADAAAEPPPPEVYAELEEDAQAIGNRRLSEILSRQIEENPNIVAVKEKRPGEGMPPQQMQADAGVVVPPAEGVEPMPVAEPPPAPEKVYTPLPVLDGKAVASITPEEPAPTPKAEAEEEAAPAPVQAAQMPEETAEMVRQAAAAQTANVPPPAPLPVAAPEPPKAVTPPPAEKTAEQLLDQKESSGLPPKAELKVHKEVRSVHVDLTDTVPAADPNAPFSSPPPARIETRDEMPATDITAVPATPVDARAQGVNTDLANQVSELSRKIAALEQENVALNGELKSALSESKQEVTSISNENWNLEKAAMRYNEAELQLKKLGQQLQMERAQCTTEKKELETQLFDPQITSQEQLARLADLERQLAEANAKLQSMGATQ
jgi:hypothetical protein